MQRIKSLLLVTVLSWTGSEFQSAFAADLPPVGSGCSVAAFLETSGQYRNHTNPNATGTNFSSATASGFGGAQYGCGPWNIQATGSLQNTFGYDQNYGAFGYNRSDLFGYGEVDIFVRDPRALAFGVGIQRQAEDFHTIGYGTANGVDVHNYSNFTEGRVFGDLYLNDSVTLGAVGFYRAGDNFFTGNGFDSQGSEYGGNVFGRYYFTPNFRVALNGALSQATYSATGFTNNYTYYSGTLSGAYKFEGTPVSIFGGLRYGGTNSSPSNSAIVTPSNNQDAYLGVRFDFGSHANSSLVESDRNGVH